MRQDVRPQPGDSRVAHGGAEREIGGEGDEPERRQQPADHADWYEDSPGVLVPANQCEQDRDCRVAERGNDVAKQRHPVQGGREPSQAARAQRVREHAEEEQTSREGEGERELARKRRGEVSTLDGVGGVEQEGQGRDGHQRRHRPLEIRQPAEGPRRHREGERADHGHELERDGVRENDRQGRDEQRRQREVEDVQREALEPLWVPAGDSTLGQEVVDQEVGRRDVSGVVAADVHVRAEQEIGPQLPDDERPSLRLLRRSRGTS